MNFRDWLVFGRIYEDKVADFFESRGFHVWRMGNFRLPWDLWIWDEVEEFSVEVKYRTLGLGGYYNPQKIANLYCRKETIPLKHFFFLFTPDNIRVSQYYIPPLTMLDFDKEGRLPGYYWNSKGIFETYCQHFNQADNILVKSLDELPFRRKQIIRGVDGKPTYLYSPSQ